MCFVVCICSATISTIILYTLLAKILVMLLFTMSATHIAKCICLQPIAMEAEGGLPFLLSNFLIRLGNSN